MKYLGVFRKEFKKRLAFTIEDIRKVLYKKHISEGYTYTLISHLLKKGEIKKITKGTYTFRDDAEVVGFAYPPFYYGLQEALSLRNIWEQEVNPIVITPRKVRQGLRKFAGSNYVVKRIGRKMFFGFEMIRYYDFWVPVSDVEKTLIDFVYFRQRISPEVLEEMKQRIRKKVLGSYLKRVPAWLKKRVLKRMKRYSAPKKKRGARTANHRRGDTVVMPHYFCGLL